MRNIHIFPTNKPTNLYLSRNNKLFYSNVVKDRAYANPQNIYITSNEKIKEGNWYITKNSLTPIFCGSGLFLNDDDKKIILTNDPNLIKDGVQPIDSEFLNWLVKNPGVEKIEVTEMLQVRWGVEWHDLPNQKEGRDPEGIYRKIYKLVIPKKDE